MNIIRFWFAKRWLKSHGWNIYIYPYYRDGKIVNYQIFGHPRETSTGGFEWAVEREKEYVKSIKKKGELI